MSCKSLIVQSRRDLPTFTPVGVQLVRECAVVPQSPEPALLSALCCQLERKLHRATHAPLLHLILFYLLVISSRIMESVGQLCSALNMEGWCMRLSSATRFQTNICAAFLQKIQVPEYSRRALILSLACTTTPWVCTRTSVSEEIHL